MFSSRSRRSSRHFLIAASIAAACLATRHQATAATATWNNAAGGNWSTGANWSPVGVPASTTDVQFNSNNSYTVTLTGATTTANVTVSDGNVTLAEAANTLTLARPSSGIADLTVYKAGGTASLTLTGGGTVTIPDILRIGSVAANSALNGTGQLVIQGGSTVNVGFDAQLGWFGGTAIVTVTGAGSVLNGPIELGVNVNSSNPSIKSSGTLTLTAGGSLIDSSGVSVAESGGNAVFNINAGGTAQVAGNVVLGAESSSLGTAGTVNLNTGGTLTVGGHTQVSNNTSVFNLAGGTLKTGSLDIGGVASRLNWTAGTLELSNSSLMIGNTTAGSLTLATNAVTIGAGKSLVVSGSSQGITIGSDTGGSLAITGGGTSSITGNGDMVIGLNAAGTLSLTGSGSTFTALGSSRVFAGSNNGSTGVINVNAGTQFNVHSLRLGDGTTASGTFNLNGGTASIAGVEVGINGHGVLNITNGGTLTSTTAYIAESSGSDAVTLTNAGSSWSLANLNLGGVTSASTGAGTLTINTGTSVTVTGSTTVWDAGSRINLAGGTLTTGIFSSNSNASQLLWTGGTLNLGSELRIANAQFQLGSDVTIGINQVLNAALITVGSGGGAAGAGTLTISGGGTAATTSNGDVWIGNNSNAGTVSVTGTGSTLATNGSGGIFVGSTGTGSLTVASSGQASAARLDVGGDSTGNHLAAGIMNINAAGTVTISGTTTIWNNSSTLTLAGGTLNTGALTASANPSGFNWSDGTLNLTNSSTTIGTGGSLGTNLATSATKLLRLSGSGQTLTLASGGTLSTASLTIGGSSFTSADQVGVTGIFNQTGGTATISGATKLNAGGLLNLAGTLNTGSMDVSSNPSGFVWTSGTLNVTNSNATIGTSGSLGTSLTVGNTQTLRISGAGTALTVGSGGTLNVNGGYVYAKSMDLTQGTSFSAGTLEIDTGTLTAGGASNSTWGGTVTGSGSLAKAGTGTLTVNAANSYTGSTSVNGGGQLVLGVNNAIANNSALMLGNASSAGTLNVQGYTNAAGSLAFGSAGGALNFTLGNSPTQAARLSIAGNAALGNGTLALNDTPDGTVAKYILISAGSVTGSFASTPSVTGYGVKTTATEVDLIHLAQASLLADPANALNVRSGMQTLGFFVANTAPSGSAAASYSYAFSPNIGTGSGTRAAGGATDAGDHQTVTYTAAPGLFNTVVTLTAGDAFTQINSGTLTISQMAYDYANPTYSAANLAFGNLHVGGTIASQSVAFSNPARTNTFQDGLNVAAATGNSLITAGSSISMAVGGSGSLAFAVPSTATAGSLAGSVSLTLTSMPTASGLDTGHIITPSAAITTSGQIYTGLSAWAVNHGGSWGTLSGTGGSTFGSNWGINQGSPGLDSGFVSSDTATLGTVLTTGSATVTLDGASPSLKSLTFNDTAAAYTLAQGTGGTLTFNNAGSTATLAVTGSGHVISAPITLNDNLAITTSAVGDSLNVSGGLSGAGKSLNKLGSGTLVLSGFASLNSATVSAGTLLLPSGTSTVSGTTKINAGFTLTLSGGTLSTGVLDTSSTSAGLNWTSGILDITNSNLSINTNTDLLGASRTLDAGKSLRVSGTGTTLTVGSSGTFNVTGGDLYARSFNAASAGTFGFTDGSITVDGGLFTPKLGSVNFNYGSGNSTYGNSYAISGIVGNSTGPTLMLQNGADSTASGDFVLIGDSGGKGTLNVAGNGSTFQTGPYNGFLLVGSYRGANGGTTYAGDGTLNITNGGQVSSYYSINIGLSGGKGVVTVDGANSKLTSTSDSVLVGSNRYVSGAFNAGGDGTLNITNGGQVSSYYSNYIGESGGKGVVTVDGANSKLTSLNGSLYVGDNRYVSGSVNAAGDGTLNITNGGQVSSYYDTYIGDSGGKGVVTMDGANSKLTSTNGYLFVGEERYVSGAVNAAGDGTLNITNGGQVSSFYSTYVGDYGGKGVVTMDGANSKLTSTNGYLFVGEGRYVSGAVNAAGDGTLNITNGGQVSSFYSTHVGDYGGKGVVTVDGANSKLSTSDSLFVGNGRYDANSVGDGTLNISNGGQVSGYYAYVGANGGKGIVAVGKSDGTDAGGSQLNLSGGLFVDSGGIGANGQLTVYNGGAVVSPYGYIGNNDGSTGVVTLGAGSSWNNTGKVYLNVGGTLNLQGGSLTATNLVLAGGNVIVLSSSPLNGNLLVSSKSSVVTLSPTVGAGTTLTAGSLSRSVGATVIFRGDSLGVNTSGMANSTNILFTTAPTTLLVGGASGVTKAILPFAIGDISNNGAGTGFVTYDSANGIRLLAANEYVTNGDSSNANIHINSASISAAGSINSLLMDNGTLNITSGITINSGAIFAASGINTIANGAIQFGSNEAIFTTIGNLTINSILVGTGGLTKSGAGTLTLSQANYSSFPLNTNMSGGTWINQGTLKLTGTGTIASGTLNIASGATLDASGVTVAITGGTVLSGTGKITGNVSISTNGHLSPGNSPGNMPGDSEEWGSGGNYDWQLQNAAGAAGSGYDTVTLDDTITLTATPADPFNINLSTLDGTDAPGLATFDTTKDYSWVLLTAAHGVSSLDLTAIHLDLTGFENSLDGGSLSLAKSGNELLLNYTSLTPQTPEPASLAILGFGGLTLLSRRRRR